ncbi:secreted protein containing DUF1565, partial [Candidatus Magnetomorum sp. HK-1]
MKKCFFLSFLTLLMLVTFVSLAFSSTHIWVDQNNGINDSSTPGTETQPFKSITYAFMKIKDSTIVVHIKAGVYDSNTSKPANEREYFPLQLRNEIIIQGESSKEECIIVGNENSNSPILFGENLSNIIIKNITFKSMKRTGGTKNGSAIELISSSGIIDNCAFIENETAGYGGGLWASLSK